VDLTRLSVDQDRRALCKTGGSRDFHSGGNSHLRGKDCRVAGAPAVLGDDADDLRTVQGRCLGGGEVESDKDALGVERRDPG